MKLGSNIDWCIEIGLRHAEVEERVAERLHRRDDLLAFLDGSGVAADDHHDVLPVELLGNERSAGALRWMMIVISSSGASAIQSR